jgi:hypothetical protein
MKLKKNVGNRQKSLSMSINVTKLRMEEKEFIQEPDTIFVVILDDKSTLANRRINDKIIKKKK